MVTTTISNHNNSLFFVVLIFILIIALKYFLEKDSNEYPFSKRTDLFSPAERSFLSVIEIVLKNQYRFFGKVRLADIVNVKSGVSKKKWSIAFNKISQKHVDFVACNPNDLSIQFVIELDDSSHNISKRKNRDIFIDHVLNAAGIPIIHVKAKRNYGLNDLKNIFLESGIIIDQKETRDKSDHSVGKMDEIQIS